MKKKNYEELIGQKFNSLKILEFLGHRKRINSNRTDPYVKCLCDCGSIIEIIVHVVKSGLQKSCGCIRKKRSDLTGMVFGYWTVLKFSYNKGTVPYYDCQCICGIIKPVNADQLLNSATISCGCKKSETISSKNRKNNPRISTAKVIYGSNYSDGNLSFDVFLELSQLPCYYCGSLPNNTFNRFIGRTTVKDSLEQGKFIYNGLDRINSNEAHNIDNVVPCCKICNRAKSNLTLEEFEIWIGKIISHQMNRKI